MLTRQELLSNIEQFSRKSCRMSSRSRNLREVSGEYGFLDDQKMMAIGFVQA